MTALEVLQFGRGASVQDAGRFGYRRFGVSTAGAMDRRALALANFLVGNRPDAAALELPLSGAEFRVSGGPVLLAAVGPGTTMAIGDRPVAANTSAQAFDGDRVIVSPPRDGICGYIAVAGGIQTSLVLGSRSCHHRSGVGGGVLTPGDRLPCVGGLGHPPLAMTKPIEFDGGEAFRIVSGPQAEFFGKETRSHFLSESYQISPRSDRMGIRLEGPALLSAKGYDIVSEGVVPGCIQVPGDGKPIVLGRDCQTTGGYPKIATVISADLDRLAQIPIGGAVRFRAISEAEAIDAARQAAKWLRDLEDAIEPFDSAPANLLSHNLIGGVTKGDDL